MNSVRLDDIYADQKVFVPSDMDGRFWNVWNWGVIPAAVIVAIARGTLRRVFWPITVAVYFAMMLGVTLGFHRYFSHSSFKTGRGFQFLLALLGCISGQTGPISWELTHRDHHRLCETEGDPHSIHDGFWHAHGWFLWDYWPRRADVRRSRWSKFPEIVFLERWAPGVYYAFGAVVTLLTGFTGAVWYWLVPTFLSWNVTMLINSWAHTWGGYDYEDFHQPGVCKARNLAWAWPILLGDNWHNNHHAYPNSAFQGFGPSQPDPNGVLIRALEKAGVVWDPIAPDPKVLARRRVSPES